MGKKKTIFKPPTVEEVEGYILEQQLDVDPIEWWNYWDSVDWYRTKNRRLVRWKSALKAFSRKEYNRGRIICSERGCKQTGIYRYKDDTGQIYWKCEAHKRIPKASKVADLYQLKQLPKEKKPERYKLLQRLEEADK